MRTGVTRFAAIATLVVAPVSLLAASARPEAVSPGGRQVFTSTQETCPTFSWAAVAGARSVDLLVFELPEGFPSPGDLSVMEALDALGPVIWVPLPGGVSSWTVPAEWRLAPGGRYAWLVRAVLDGGAEEWADPAFFEVLAAPSEAEVRRAIEVLSQYLESQSGPATGVARGRAPAARVPVRTTAPADAQAPSLPTGATAIKGQLTATTGETFGVMGISHSPEGAGVAGVNAGGGDLVVGFAGDARQFTVANDGTVLANSFVLACDEPITAYPDADEDTYGAVARGVEACTPPAGYVSAAGDCDDGDPAVNSGATEVCDGIDNDCDTQTDEELGQATCGVGACQRTVDNCVGGVPQGCVPGDPGAETCNGLDDDCDGAADEEFPGLGGPCDTGLAGVCAAGTLRCDGGSTSCQQTTASSPEVCDGADNDCDGAADEENPGGGAACDGADDDLCAEGTMTCESGALTCSDTTGDSADVCNGVDDDCDPASSDGAGDPLLGAPCDGTDGDFCKEGSWTCEGGSLTCSDASDTSQEKCGGGDEDCDMLTDAADTNDIDGWYFRYDQPLCENQEGVCAGSRKPATICVNGTWNGCQGQEYWIHDSRYDTPAERHCDGVDNDCDGQIDEGCDNDDDNYCVIGMTVVGTPATCTAGGGDCNDSDAAVNPGATEICNNVDDDCDSSMDEGCDDDNDDYCQSGMTIVGTPLTCTAGGGDCDDASAPVNPGATELCNAVDDDCDASTDEGFSITMPDGAVETQLGSACGVGACAGGMVVCQPSQTGITCSTLGNASTEVCDGVDNDCDGVTDEGFSVGEVCLVGTGGCTRQGWLECSGDGTGSVCSAVAGEPEAEVCNAVDDDCDSLTDAADTDDVVGGYLRYDQPSCEYQAGVCAGAKKPAVRCVSGGWGACQADDYLANSSRYEGSYEMHCDGYDNDCDGQVDEDFTAIMLDGSTKTGPGQACGVGLCAGGVTLCNVSQTGIVCSTSGNASTEVCADGIDNDCDGQTDEGC